jgi:hypothetical protein
MWNGSFESSMLQVRLPMAVQPENRPKSSPRSDAGESRLKALNEGNPHTDPLKRRNYANGMAELQRQWPLSSKRQQVDLLARAEQMNRDARASTASSSKATPLKPTAIATVSWDPEQWEGESDLEFHLRLHGSRDERTGMIWECEVVGPDSD